MEMRAKLCIALCRKGTAVLIPSILLLLYLLITDKQATRQLSHPVWTQDAQIGGEPFHQVYNFSKSDLDKRRSFSTGLSGFLCLMFFFVNLGVILV